MRRTYNRTHPKLERLGYMFVALLLFMTFGLVDQHRRAKAASALPAEATPAPVVPADTLPAAVGAPMEGPLKGQKRPPCKPKGAKGLPEVELKGGCWWRVADAKPPCEEGYDHPGGCYLPVPERMKPPPSAITR